MVTRCHDEATSAASVRDPATGPPAAGAGPPPIRLAKNARWRQTNTSTKIATALPKITLPTAVRIAGRPRMVTNSPPTRPTATSAVPAAIQRTNSRAFSAGTGTSGWPPPGLASNMRITITAARVTTTMITAPITRSRSGLNRSKNRNDAA